MLGLAFHAMADILAGYETSREFWHAAAIAGHSSFSNIPTLDWRNVNPSGQKCLHCLSAA
jgi:hypothetical protein